MIYSSREVAYEKINDIIKSGNILCMCEVGRNGIVGKIIGVSYSEDGLRGIANKSGRYLYTGATNFSDAKKLPKSRNIVTQKFVPSAKPTKEEVLWIDKSYRLLNIR